MRTARPRIGVTTYRESAHWGAWDVHADLLPTRYSDAIGDAGGVSVLLPPSPPEYAGVVLDGVHGVLISGGPDVDPYFYGEDRHPMTGDPRAERDEWELALVREAVARDLPLLGVCRGAQVLNVALGGSLLQHLADLVASDRHAPVANGYGRHDVALVPGSRLAELLGQRLNVATNHHQAMHRLGAGLVVCGRAEDDVIEAVELTTSSWTFGVQWHPEVHDGKALFTALVDACVGGDSRRATLWGPEVEERAND